MKVKEIYLILIGVFIFLAISVMTSMSMAETFIIGLQVYFLLRFVNNIGNTICFFDFLCFYSVLDTLLMPVLGYNLYNKNYLLSNAMGWIMRVPEQTYFSFLIPANLAFFVGVYFLSSKFNSAFYKLMVRKLFVYGKDKGNIGIALTIIGFVFSYFSKYIQALGFVAYLISMLKYVGPVYIYFSNSPIKSKALILSMLSFLIEAVIYGMFGEFVMYLILLLIIISLKFNFSFYSKLTGFVVGIILIFTLQSIKSAYRIISWKGKEVEGLSLKTSSKVEVFSTLFYRSFTDFNKILNKKSFFPVYVRLNQGYLISRAMDYVPRVEPFADGETMVRSLGGIIVPRFIWPDKPESGGKENLSRFLGIKQKIDYSMNIGPYGEAYGNFGPIYGILFVFFYGLLLSYLFYVIINKSIKRPSLILWTPILFFSTLTVETDVLSTVNSLVKTGVFMYILFWFVKKFFKVSL